MLEGPPAGGQRPADVHRVRAARTRTHGMAQPPRLGPQSTVAVPGQHPGQYGRRYGVPGTGAGGVPAPSATWQLVPPIPKELTPAVRSRSGRGHGVLARCTARPSSPNGMAGWGVSKLRLGGSSRWWRLSSAFNSPTRPEAAPR